MKQISNTNLTSYKLLILIVFFISFLFFSFMSFIFSMFQTEGLHDLEIIKYIIILAFFPFYYLLFGRFQTVTMDEERLSFKSFFKKGSVQKSRLISLTSEIMPYHLLFKQGIGLVLRYQDEEGRFKKIRFLSNEYSFGGDYRKLDEIKELKDCINSNMVNANTRT